MDKIKVKLKLLKSLTINFLLFIVAIILLLPLTIVNLIIVIIKYFKDGVIFTLSNYFIGTAIDIDKFGNRNLRTLWNLTLRKEGGHDFGDINETISEALGINKKMGTITKAGCVLCKILNIFDKNHCEKSARDFILEEK
jgi:hypothetical protein